MQTGYGETFFKGPGLPKAFPLKNILSSRKFAVSFGRRGEKAFSQKIAKKMKIGFPAWVLHCRPETKKYKLYFGTPSIDFGNPARSARSSFLPGLPRARPSSFSTSYCIIGGIPSAGDALCFGANGPCWVQSPAGEPGES